MQSDDDNLIRTHFARLRQEHEGRTPEFEACWREAQRRKSARSGGAARRWVVAAALAIGLGVWGWLQLKDTPKQGPSVVEMAWWDQAQLSESAELPWQSRVLVSEWHGPTGFLLKESAAGVWR